MNIDVVQEINAVERQVGTRTLAAGEARVVTISRTYNAPLADVWDACTNPDRIRRWFLPISGDLQVGGRYQLEGNAGGITQRCHPPHSFAVTWEYGGEVSWVEVHLTVVGDDRTRFELEHIAHVDDKRWAEFGPGAVGVGWDMGLIGLGVQLSGGSVDPAEGTAWAVSASGRQFATLSSERWGAASVAAGTPEAEAQAAAQRTTAFYTGLPEPQGQP